MIDLPNKYASMTERPPHSDMESLVWIPVKQLLQLVRKNRHQKIELTHGNYYVCPLLQSIMCSHAIRSTLINLSKIQI